MLVFTKHRGLVRKWRVLKLYFLATEVAKDKGRYSVCVCERELWSCDQIVYMTLILARDDFGVLL